MHKNDLLFKYFVILEVRFGYLVDTSKVIAIENEYFNRINKNKLSNNLSCITNFCLKDDNTLKMYE